MPVEKKLTLKQKKFFKELPTAKHATEAALKAGYAESSAKVSAHRNITQYNSHLIEVLEKHGLTEDKIAETLIDGLEASTIFFFGGKLMGKLNQSAAEKLAKQGIEISGDDFLEIPDHYARHKYLDLLVELRGLKKKSDINIANLGGEVTIKWAGSEEEVKSLEDGRN